MPENTKDIKIKHFQNFPFVYVDLPNEETAEKIIRRSILIGMIIEVIS